MNVVEWPLQESPQKRGHTEDDAAGPHSFYLRYHRRGNWAAEPLTVTIDHAPLPRPWLPPGAGARGAASALSARTFLRRRPQRILQPAAAAGAPVEATRRHAGGHRGPAAIARSRRDPAAAGGNRRDDRRAFYRRGSRCRMRGRFLPRHARRPGWF